MDAQPIEPNGRPNGNSESPIADETLSIPGYVLGHDSLSRIDRSAKKMFSKVGDITQEFLVIGKETTSCATLNEVTRLFEESRLVPIGIGLSYTSNDGGLRVLFQPNGQIRVYARGQLKGFENQFENIKRELRGCDQEPNFLVTSLVFSRYSRRILTGALFLIFATSFFLAWETCYYFYAASVGVDIDPKLIPDGNAYFKEVEQALQKGSDAEKIDVLLRGQLRMFSNVSGVTAVPESRMEGW